MEEKDIKTTDYIYCKDCQEYCDYWKYGCLKDTGHEGHKVRYVTKTELKSLKESCLEDGCFKEEFLISPERYEEKRKEDMRL